MRTPDFRDLLLLMAVLLALLSGQIAAHEIVHSPPVLSAVEAVLIVSSSALTVVSVAAAARLRDRPETDTEYPAGNRIEAADS